MTLRRLAAYGPAIVLAIALLALWQLYVQVSQVGPRFLPSPTAVIAALVIGWRRMRRNRPLSVHTIARGLFPRRLIRNDSTLADVGKQTLVPYSADYHFFRADH